MVMPVRICLSLTFAFLYGNLSRHDLIGTRVAAAADVQDPRRGRLQAACVTRSIRTFTRPAAERIKRLFASCAARIPQHPIASSSGHPHHAKTRDRDTLSPSLLRQCLLAPIPHPKSPTQAQSPHRSASGESYDSHKHRSWMAKRERKIQIVQRRHSNMVLPSYPSIFGFIYGRLLSDLNNFNVEDAPLERAAVEEALR